MYTHMINSKNLFNTMIGSMMTVLNTIQVLEILLVDMIYVIHQSKINTLLHYLVVQIVKQLTQNQPQNQNGITELVQSVAVKVKSHLSTIVNIQMLLQFHKVTGLYSQAFTSELQVAVIWVVLIIQRAIIVAVITLLQLSVLLLFHVLLLQLVQQYGLYYSIRKLIR